MNFSETLYALGCIPHEMVVAIGQGIVYNHLIGQTDISGDGWAKIFARAVSGIHEKTPQAGPAVIRHDCAWLTKTVKPIAGPFDIGQIRLISGRNSPFHDFGITDPFADVQQTGEAVLRIWNNRIQDAIGRIDDLRTAVLMRDMENFRFALFESETEIFEPVDYRWRLNSRNNFEGVHQSNDCHTFTWQPHGGQFTIIRQVPDSVIQFSIRKPPKLNFEQTLKQVCFDESWVAMRR